MDRDLDQPPAQPSRAPPRHRVAQYSKPVPYRKEGGFSAKKPDTPKWKRVVKEPEFRDEPKPVQETKERRVYGKELIWQVGREEQSQGVSSLSLDILKREMKRVKGQKGKHKAKHAPPKWCADVRLKTDPLTRSLKSLLNKLAPTNYATILSKMQELVNEEAALAIAVHIFDKASAESRFSEVYARLCEDLITVFPEFKAFLVTT